MQRWMIKKKKKKMTDEEIVIRRKELAKKEKVAAIWTRVSSADQYDFCYFGGFLRGDFRCDLGCRFFRCFHGAGALGEILRGVGCHPVGI